MAKINKPRFEIQIIDSSRVNKYAMRTLNRQDGLLYADLDFDSSGRLKPGALPDRLQDTAAKCVQAKRLHDAAADQLLQSFFGDRPAPQPDGLLARARQSVQAFFRRGPR